MSDKDRAKKDHMRTDKKNKAMRERENPRMQRADPPHQARDESNLTDTEPAPSEGTEVSHKRHKTYLCSLCLCVASLGNGAISDLEALVDDRERLAQLSFGDAKRWVREERIPTHKRVEPFLTEELPERLHLGRRSVERRHRLACLSIAHQFDNPKESDVARRAD